MANSRDQQIEELFANALEWPPPEWEARLRQLTADESVVEEVLRLLNSQLDDSNDEVFKGFSGGLPMSEAEESTIDVPVDHDPVAEIKKILTTLITQPTGKWILGGGYEGLSVLGQGSFGVTVHAKCPNPLRHVVLKIPHPSKLPNDVGRLRHYLEQCFDDEARWLAAHECTGIPTVYRFATPKVPAELSADNWVRTFAQQLRQNPEFWLEMKYIEGETLESRIRRPGRLEMKDAARIVADVAESLAELHRQTAHKPRVLHRDLKPANILLDNDGKTWLVDFGLVVAYDSQQTGQLAGTPRYMSPQKFNGSKIGLQDDQWSLGVILYESISGVPPFESPDGSLAKLKDNICNLPHVPLGQLASERNFVIDNALAEICDKCLAKNAANRFQTVLGLAEELRKWLASGQKQQIGETISGQSIPAPIGDASNPPSNRHISPTPEFSEYPLSVNAFSYIVRDVENDLASMVKSSPLVCITGPPGVGKTSLMNRVPLLLGATWTVVGHGHGGRSVALMDSFDTSRFQRFFFQWFQLRFGPIDGWPELESKLMEKRCVILIDELGEAKAPGLRDLIHGLYHLVLDHPDRIRIVVTLREREHDPHPIQTYFNKNELDHSRYTAGWQYVRVPSFDAGDARKLFARLPGNLPVLLDGHWQVVSDQLQVPHLDTPPIAPRKVQLLCQKLLDAFNQKKGDQDLIRIMSNERSYT